MENGRNWIIKWLTGALWGFLVLAFSIMANNVIANDKESRARDYVLENKIVLNTIAIVEMKQDIKYMRASQEKLIRKQDVILNLLKDGQ